MLTEVRESRVFHGPGLSLGLPETPLFTASPLGNLSRGDHIRGEKQGFAILLVDSGEADKIAQELSKNVSLLLPGDLSFDNNASQLPTACGGPRSTRITYG